MLQLFVENDIVPSEYVPEELRALGYPIDTTLVSSTSSVAALTLRVVLPVLPAPQINIGPPVTSLDLDMAPPPQTRKRGAPVIATPASAATGPDQAGPTPERKWTTVRRRELINRQQWAAAAAEEAATKPKTPRKGS